MRREAEVRRTKGAAVHPMTLRVLKKIGEDIALARRARRISVEEFSDRAGISRATLYRLEQGDPGVSLNTFVMTLHVLGLLDKLSDIVDVRTDDVGLMVMRADIPKRIVKRRATPSSRKEHEVSEDPPDIVGW